LPPAPPTPTTLIFANVSISGLILAIYVELLFDTLLQYTLLNTKSQSSIINIETIIY